MTLSDVFARAAAFFAAPPAGAREWREFAGARDTKASGAGLEFNLTDAKLAEYLRGGAVSASGVAATPETVLRVGVAWRCICIRAGVVGNMPLDLYRRADEKRRLPAVGYPLRDVLTRKPNRWQTPGQFKRTMQTHKLLHGNAYALKRRLGGAVRELIPLDAARMAVTQNTDLSLSFRYQTLTGGAVSFGQDEIFRLHGLSLDGVTGLSVIGQQREAIGLSVQAERAAAKLFKNGQFRSQVYQMPEGKSLSEEAYKRLKNDLGDLRGVDNDDAGGAIIIEEGLQVAKPAFSADDLQFLQLRQFTRTDVGMFYGVPPFLYGDTEKSTSWGTGIGQMNLAFLQYTVQEDLTDWEESIARDCLDSDPVLYAKFDTKGFLRMDAAERREWNKAALGHGGGQPWETLNEVRAVEEMDPVPESWADEIRRVAQQKAAAFGRQGAANESVQTPSA